MYKRRFIQSDDHVDNVEEICKENASFPKAISQMLKDNFMNSVNQTKYDYHIAELNRNFTKWICNHVNETPHANLTPVFVDYFNHIICLDKQFYPDKFVKKNHFEFNFASKGNNDPTVLPSKVLIAKRPDFLKINFGTNASSNETKLPSIIEDELLNHDLGSSIHDESTVFDDSGEENEDYEPPNPEDTNFENGNFENRNFQEEKAVYSKRIKLFLLKDNGGEFKWCNFGIANLYIKPNRANDKILVVIRSVTNLAKILLNVDLSKAKISRAGIKHISFLCLPNPPIPDISTEKPCKFALELETESDADEILSALTKTQ